MTRSSLRAGLALALAWTAAAQPAPLDARLDRLAERLSLSAEQTAALDAVAARQEVPDPASLWTAAAEVCQVPTAGQLAELREAGAVERAAVNKPGRRPPMPSGKPSARSSTTPARAAGR